MVELIVLAVLAAGAVLYAVEKHLNLASFKAEAKSLVARLESYATADEAKLKAFIAAEAARLRGKL